MLATIFFLELLALINLVDYRTAFNVRIYTHEIKPTNRLDRELIYTHKPNQLLEGVADGGDVTALYDVESPTRYDYSIRYDHNGFRNDTELHIADIVVLGDSFVEGTLTDYSQIMTSVLGNLQNSTVANLGQSGYSTTTELVVLKRHGLSLDPSHIVLMYFEGNDWRNEIRYELVMSDWETYFQRWTAWTVTSFSKNAIQAMAAFLGNPKPSGWSKSALLDRNGADPVRMYFVYSGQPLTALQLRGLDLTSSALAETHEIAKSNNIQLTIVFVPTKFRVYSGLIEIDPGSDLASWVVNDMPRRLGEIVANISDDIGFLDLTPTFLNSANSGELLYFRDDTHWNPAGHRLAAEAIGDHLDGFRANAASSEYRADLQ